MTVSVAVTVTITMTVAVALVNVDRYVNLAFMVDVFHDGHGFVHGHVFDHGVRLGNVFDHFFVDGNFLDDWIRLVLHNGFHLLVSVEIIYIIRVKD